MNRFAKFLEKKFKVVEDTMGIPSIINVDGSERSLVVSLDRVRMKSAMMQFLVEKVALQDSDATAEAENYVERRYKEYMEFVMKL
tara:strand:- start:9 stop:263 length:255 start_codon:yes stop_codon:yes gene_type:complete